MAVKDPVHLVHTIEVELNHHSLSSIGLHSLQREYGLTNNSSVAIWFNIDKYMRYYNTAHMQGRERKNQGVIQFIAWSSKVSKKEADSFHQNIHFQQHPSSCRKRGRKNTEMPAILWSNQINKLRNSLQKWITQRVGKKYTEETLEIVFFPRKKNYPQQLDENLQTFTWVISIAGVTSQQNQWLPRWLNSSNVSENSGMNSDWAWEERG